MSDELAQDDVASKRCCERDMTTPFCPYCGKAGAGHSLETLLQHCKAALAHSERSFQESKRQGSERGMRLKSAPIRKWTAWVNALSKVLSDD